MFAGIDLRLLAPMVAIAIFVYQNWRAGIARGERQDMLSKSLEDRIRKLVIDHEDMEKDIDAAKTAQRAICEEKAAAIAATYLRRDQFDARIKPIEENLRALVDSNLPVELAKIQVSQLQILTSLKRLEDKIFGQ